MKVIFQASTQMAISFTVEGAMVDTMDVLDMEITIEATATSPEAIFRVFSHLADLIDAAVSLIFKAVSHLADLIFSAFSHLVNLADPAIFQAVEVIFRARYLIITQDMVFFPTALVIIEDLTACTVVDTDVSFVQVTSPTVTLKVPTPIMRAIFQASSLAATPATPATPAIIEALALFADMDKLEPVVQSLAATGTLHTSETIRPTTAAPAI